MAPIGVFDSGYGGLTVLKEIVTRLPGYDFLYLGDNARAPYGTRSFETVYQYTRQCVRWMFDRGCPLIILACNTASAKALRTIQQKDLPEWGDDLRVLGVIRPTAEIIGRFSPAGKIGILATPGTVSSESYLVEIHKFFPEAHVYQHACPLWVPLIENGEQDTEGAIYFIGEDVRALLSLAPGIDTILLGCTHYPLIQDVIQRFVPDPTRIISQGSIVADSLVTYLQRHTGIDRACSKKGRIVFYTTDATTDFDRHSALFFGKEINAVHINLD